jgi:hypothetical protein
MPFCTGVVNNVVAAFACTCLICRLGRPGGDMIDVFPHQLALVFMFTPKYILIFMLSVYGDQADAVYRGGVGSRFERHYVAAVHLSYFIKLCGGFKENRANIAFVRWSLPSGRQD